MEVLSAVKDIIVAAAAIYAAYRAGDGIKLWRQKLTGETDFEVAREVLERLMVMRKTFWIAREPLILAHEFGDDYQGLREGDPGYWEDRATGYSNVYGTRWNQLRDSWVEFEGYAVKAEALWGDEVSTLIQDIRACINRIPIAMNAFIDDINSHGRDFATDRNYARSVRADMHSRYRPDGDYEDNALSAEFHTAYRAAENFCRSKLEV